MRDWWETALAWLEGHARWSALRSLGSSNLVKASVLMPAFGYMLLLNENVHQYLTIKYDGKLLDYLPAMWRVWLLFYGSFFLAFATILYTTYCPAIVKRYASPYERADAETEYLHRLGSIKGLKDELKKVYDTAATSERPLFTLKPLNLTTNYLGESEQLRFISNALIHLWLISNNRRPNLRISILALFSVGLLLIAIPAVLTFLQVTVLAIKRLLL